LKIQVDYDKDYHKTTVTILIDMAKYCSLFGIATDEVLNFWDNIIPYYRKIYS